jgi:hypothetical protein
MIRAVATLPMLRSSRHSCIIYSISSESAYEVSPLGLNFVLKASTPQSMPFLPSRASRAPADSPPRHPLTAPLHSGQPSIEPTTRYAPVSIPIHHSSNTFHGIPLNLLYAYLSSLFIRSALHQSCPSRRLVTLSLNPLLHFSASLVFGA